MLFNHMTRILYSFHLHQFPNDGSQHVYGYYLLQNQYNIIEIKSKWFESYLVKLDCCL